MMFSSTIFPPSFVYNCHLSWSLFQEMNGKSFALRIQNLHFLHARSSGGRISREKNPVRTKQRDKDLKILFTYQCIKSSQVNYVVILLLLHAATSLHNPVFSLFFQSCTMSKFFFFAPSQNLSHAERKNEDFNLAHHGMLREQGNVCQAFHCEVKKCS